MFTQKIHTLIKTCTLRRFSSKSELLSISFDEKTGFTVLTLQRPTVNSLNLELLEVLSSTLESYKHHNGLILTSKYDKAFCAGLDFQELSNPKPERFKEFWTKLQDVWLNLHRCDFPVVALVNGHAPAGGCLLAIGTDYRIMRSNCIIGLNETPVGMVVPPWLIDNMINTIGFRQGELALTTGRLFSTNEAFDIGLVHEVVESTEDGMIKALNFLNNSKKIPKKSASISKSSVRKDIVERMLKTRNEELNNTTKWVFGEYFQNHLQSFLESRKKKV